MGQTETKPKFECHQRVTISNPTDEHRREKDRAGFIRAWADTEDGIVYQVLIYLGMRTKVFHEHELSEYLSPAEGGS